MLIPENICKPMILCDDKDIIQIAPGTPFRDISRNIRRGKNICMTGTYGFAMAFYAWLKKQVSASFPADDYTGWRRQRNVLHRYQSQIWIRVSHHRPELDLAPGNPWLHDFYPDKSLFLITFADYLGLNGARQWHEKGVHYPVLDFPLHPFYGVYFPSRDDHLLLLDRWLADNNDFTRAIDIGTGCGILAFMMLKRGIREVHATDINPNSIFSVRQDIQNTKSRIKGGLHLELADLLGTFEPENNDLVVFNPPWIPSTPEKTLDRASYYEPGFFDQVFYEFQKKCPKGTTIALMFSNFAILAGLTSRNPIEEALTSYKEHFQLMDLHKQRVSQKTSKKKSWLQEIRRQEEVELFIIGRI